MIRLRAAFSADSQRLAVVTGDDRVSFWDATTGTDVGVVREPGASFRSIGFSPRGRLLAGLGENGAGYFWDAASGERRGVFRATPHQWSVLAFRLDGRRLACAVSSPDWEGEIRLFDVESGRSLLVLPSRGFTSSLQFSADGHRLMAMTTQQGEVTIWDGTPWGPKEHHGLQ